MQQVKLFKTVETELGQLETEINRWLRETGARVISINGNIAPQSTAGPEKAPGGTRSFPPSDVMLVVLYETADTV